MSKLETILQFSKIIMMLIFLAFFILLGIRMIKVVDRFYEIADIYEARVR